MKKRFIIIPVVGILAIAAVLMFALSLGFDGQMTALGIGGIGAVATGGSMKAWNSRLKGAQGDDRPTIREGEHGHSD